jgi:hypothetical protein
MRDLTAAFIAELEAKTKSIALFYEGEFASGTIRLWSGLGTINWNGEDWLGAGQIASVSPIKETSEIKAEGVQFSISGIQSVFISLVLSEVEQNKQGLCYIGFIDANGGVIVDPALAFDGLLDVSALSDDGKTIVIKLNYESKLRDLERAREFRYTDESQKVLFPDDLGFEFVPSLQEWSGKWGES